MKELVPPSDFYAKVFTAWCFRWKELIFLSVWFIQPPACIPPGKCKVLPHVNLVQCTAQLSAGPSNCQTKLLNQTERWNRSCLNLSHRFVKTGNKSTKKTVINKRFWWILKVYEMWPVWSSDFVRGKIVTIIYVNISIYTLCDHF